MQLIRGHGILGPDIPLALCRNIIAPAPTPLIPPIQDTARLRFRCHRKRRMGDYFASFRILANTCHRVALHRAN